VGHSTTIPQSPPGAPRADSQSGSPVLGTTVRVTAGASRLPRLGAVVGLVGWVVRGVVRTGSVIPFVLRMAPMLR
jgi:hypothetical protein